MNNIIDMKTGGVLLSTIPLIPDEGDNLREARALSPERGEAPGVAALKGDVMADLYRAMREVGSSRVSVALDSRVPGGEPEVWYSIWATQDKCISNKLLSEAVKEAKDFNADNEAARLRKIADLRKQLTELGA